MANIKTENSSINTKVTMAGIASSFGSILSIFLNTLLINLPFLSEISDEDLGILKTSLTAVITGTLTLVVGYYTSPGEGDGIIKQED